MRRIYLSPPSLSGDEAERLSEALASGWIAPVGPELDAFEREVCEQVGVAHGVALNSGTAALHLALQLCGVGPGDEVVCPTLTFVATANAARYCNATPLFVDSERVSWNLDPELLAELLKTRAAEGRPPKAVVTVDLYGQSADYDAIVPLCERYGVALIEDAAEALGATHHRRPLGGFGRMGVFSFNGNKIITTSGGGMLVSDDPSAIERARHLATQARQPAPHYEHREIGYNYRMSNLLAALGRGQLATLEARVERRRGRFERYRDALDDMPGVQFTADAPWGRSNRWLTVMTLDPARAGATPTQVRSALELEQIEARPVWKPMHLQPAFAGATTFGGEVAEGLFDTGLCLPSGDDLDDQAFERTVRIIRRCLGAPG